MIFNDRAIKKVAEAKKRTKMVVVHVVIEMREASHLHEKTYWSQEAHQWDGTQGESYFFMDLILKGIQR